MSILQATDRTFAQQISQPGITLVDFWAPWCGPCRILGPILDQLDREMTGKVNIVKVNVDENPLLAQRYQIMSIPTLKLFKNGRELTTISGVQPLEALKRLVLQNQ